MISTTKPRDNRVDVLQSVYDELMNIYMEEYLKPNLPDKAIDHTITLRKQYSVWMSHTDRRILVGYNHFLTNDEIQPKTAETLFTMVYDIADDSITLSYDAPKHMTQMISRLISAGESAMKECVC